MKSVNESGTGSTRFPRRCAKRYAIIMKKCPNVLVAILLSACSNEPIIGHYTLSDGKTWIEIVTKPGVGSQLNIAREQFHNEAKRICSGKEYKESDIIEFTQPSGRMPPGGLLDGEVLNYVSQIAKRTGFIFCLDGNA